MTDAAKIHLGDKGYEPGILFSPFVCSALESDNVFKVSREGENDITEMHAPFFVDGSLHGDEEYKRQLSRVIQHVRDDSKEFLKKRKRLPASMNLRRRGFGDDLEGIRAKANTEVILFIVGEGSLVSGGRSLGKGMPGAVLSAILNPFMIPLYMTFDYSKFFTHAALVDLKTGEILWANYDGDYSVDPTKVEYYSEKWSKNLMGDIPFRVDKNKQALEVPPAR